MKPKTITQFPYYSPMWDYNIKWYTMRVMLETNGGNRSNTSPVLESTMQISFLSAGLVHGHSMANTEHWTLPKTSKCPELRPLCCCCRGVGVAVAPHLESTRCSNQHPAAELHGSDFLNSKCASLSKQNHT